MVVEIVPRVSWGAGGDQPVCLVRDGDLDGVAGVVGHCDVDGQRLAGEEKFGDGDAGIDGAWCAGDAVCGGEDAFEFVKGSLVALQVAVLVGDPAQGVAVQR